MPPRKSGVVPPHSKAGEAPAVKAALSVRAASSGKAAGRFGVRRQDAAFSLWKAPEKLLASAWAAPFGKMWADISALGEGRESR